MFPVIVTGALSYLDLHTSSMFDLSSKFCIVGSHASTTAAATGTTLLQPHKSEMQLQLTTTNCELQLLVAKRLWKLLCYSC